MCGIAGFVGAGGADELRGMTEALLHRGPDAGGCASDPEHGVWLGHRRLAVLDPEGGEQPMWTAERDLVVVFNGEIYDAPSRRAELEARGHRFRSDHSDTEVLLHGWREWGQGLVDRLDGMWAFALYDLRERCLFLSRDRFGEKPLYWAQRRGTFAFASELEALMRHPSLERNLDPLALRKYLAHGYVPAPGALYEGVRKLAAGTCLRFDLGDATPRVTRRWALDLEPDPALAARSVESLAEELRAKLEAAVSRRLVADVPVGVLLSGGLDSSAVAVFAARHRKPGELRTFSVGFDEPSFDESRHAARMARHVASEHLRTPLSVEGCRELLPGIVERLDEPLADASLLPTSLLCQAARREVTVALGGDGGDELFAGYDPFRALRAAEAWSRLVPRPLHRAVRLLASRLPASHRYMSLDFRLKRTLAGLDHPAHLWNPVWLAPLGPAELGELLGEPVDVEEVYAEAIEAWDRARGGSLVDRTLQFFTELYLQNGVLTKVDRASMSHSLEVRSPFLDREVVDFVRRLPADLKLRGGETKFLLRRALAPLLPREIVKRRKQGFGVPVGRWIAAGAAPFDHFAPWEGEARGPARMRRRRLAEQRAGRADHRLYLYADWVLGRFLGRTGRLRPTPAKPCTGSVEDPPASPDDVFPEVSPLVRRRPVSRVERRSRHALRVQGRARRRRAPRLAQGRLAAGGHRGRALPGRLLLRRLSPRRRDGPVLAPHVRREALRRARRSGARRLQRLPGAVRVGSPARCADAKPRPPLRVRVPPRARGAGGRALHVASVGGRRAAPAGEARGGRLRGEPRAAGAARG